ncbi:GPI-N-acetylgalactosamine transferase PGAP4-like [Saccoglossus kowalevskii]|uniref:Uncharacterized protein LOC100369821 n=1 Tax=Saccoglossus kowalevskii TaxID=10224 RepID=A0ABM0GST0_SACKO|nr:PREDICTED: uncharacterized protein LOC100369821 [Saccoglossus kowalevskii]
MMVICDVDQHPETHKEAEFISQFIPTIIKYEFSREEGPRKTMAEVAYKNEKNDYTFCLDAVSRMNASYTIILQDDALVRWDFFDILDHILKTRIENTYEKGELVKNERLDEVAAVKLFMPEKWQGYSWSQKTVLTLFAIGCTWGPPLAAIYIYLINQHVNTSYLARLLVFLLSVFYVMLLPVLIGQHYVLELRRISVQLYNMYHAPGCCIPGTLYNTKNVGKIVSYLQSVEGTREYPVDIAISDYIRKSDMIHYLIIPNVVYHIGMFSTLHREPKDPEHFQDV